ncbi:hypothetical protein Veis_3217 [Verminephrobacter eiseniae EF01-2]|uniref:Uncharacterized protein n=1 Tax=Verminephrobacter eiseniae (strain EF01-2) TaxID=391735 RepID=A1WMU0_VEREI|nr:hypothetical protein Veis_3217 [Verminephrobacter eiseniae EF01-2]
MASDATPRCASMASADRQMIDDATLVSRHRSEVAGCAHDPIAAASFQRPGIVCKLRQWPVSTGSDSTGQFFFGPRRPSP